MNEQYASVIDVRRIPHHKRHALIFGTFDALPDGEALQLINDHDPEHIDANRALQMKRPHARA